MSGITIPRAGIEAGRAPRAQGVEAPALGAAAAAFGETMRGVGETLERDRQERELTAFRTDIAGKLGEARLRYQRAVDPDEVAEGWTPEIDALRQEALSGVSGAVRDRAAATFEQLAVPHKLAVGEHEIGLRREARLFGANRQTETTVSQAAMAGDPETEEALFAALSETYATLVASGDMTAGEAGAALQKAQGEARRATALRLLTDDPARLLAEIDGPRFDLIDPAQRATLRDRADGAVKAEAARAGAEAARAANEAAAAADARLTEIAAIVETGQRSADEGFLLSPEAQARPGYQRAADAVALRNIIPGLATMPPDRLDAAIAEEKARPLAQRHETRVLEALERVRDRSRAAWKDDPIAHAQAVGMRKPADLPDPSAFGDEAIVGALRERTLYARSLVAEGYTETESYFTKAERAQLAALTGPERPAAERARLAGLMAAAFGPERGPRALAEIGGDALFGHAGGLIASGGDPATAEKIFRGQEELKAGNVTPPPDKQLRGLVELALGDLIDPEILTAEMRQTLREAAVAIMVSEGVTPQEGDAADKAFTRGLQLAMGAVFNGNRIASGGVQEIRMPSAVSEISPGAVGGLREGNLAPTREGGDSHQVLLPPGMTPEILEAGLARVADEMAAGRKPWPALARSGGAPIFAGAPLDVRWLQSSRLVAVGRDRFNLRVDFNGSTMWVLDSETGEPFEFSASAVAALGATR